jgi:hypothetical protein
MSLSEAVCRFMLLSFGKISFKKSKRKKKFWQDARRGF